MQVFERAALIHYTEIGLKGRNRASFENRLRDNLSFACRGLPADAAVRISSRLLVPVLDPDSAEAVLAACSRVPGVAHVSDALVLSRSMHDIRKAAEVAMGAALEAEGPGATSAARPTFAVDSRRSNTDHPVSSNEMNVDVGRHLQDVYGLAVDLQHPGITVHIEVVQGSAYVYARRLAGPGGLPVGTSGKVISLLSGGIDSPVASWRLAKRGAVVVGLHFSGAPQTTDASTEDVFETAELLSSSGGIGRVYSVPFGDLQRRISLDCPPDLRVLLYRRLMLRVAEALAADEGARALVTGESLGQVASQTLENIAAVEAAATLPVLRPLIGSDKSEIIAEAKGLGTYEISIRPHPDCCTLFMPRRPATHATAEQLDAAEAPLDIPSMVGEAIAQVRYRDFACAAYRPPDRGIGSAPQELAS